MKFRNPFKPTAVASAADTYLSKCARMLATESGARTLQQTLLVQQSASPQGSRKANLIRRQVGAAKAATLYHETQAELQRCAQLRAAQLDECAQAVERLTRHHEQCLETVAQRQTDLEQRRKRAEPVVMQAEREGREATELRASRIEAYEAELADAEARNDDASAAVAAQKLIEAKSERADVQTVSQIRAVALRAQVAEAEQKLREAQADAEAAAENLTSAQIRLLQVQADEAAAAYVVASAKLFDAVRAAPKSEAARSVPPDDHLRVVVQNKEHVPGAAELDRAIRPTLAIRDVERVAQGLREPDASAFEVDPETLVEPVPQAA